MEISLNESVTLTSDFKFSNDRFKFCNVVSRVRTSMLITGACGFSGAPNNLKSCTVKISNTGASSDSVIVIGSSLLKMGKFLLKM